MAYEGMRIAEHIAHFEALPGVPTPVWTRLVIETGNGDLWVAACNFWPELESQNMEPERSVPYLNHEGHMYISLEWAMGLSDDARILGEAIKRSLPTAICMWRKKTARRP